MSAPRPAREITELAKEVVETCVACDTCVRDCGFLQRHGDPGTIAAALIAEETDPGVAFECSLCGLCDAVCPTDVRVSDFLRRARETAVAGDRSHLKPYGALRRYETLGGAWPFRHHGLPEGCDTILFPGCALPGSRPAPLWELYRHLQKEIPRLGLVLDCCAKPSHDLGDRGRFKDRFGTLRKLLLEHRVRRVLVACPNCLRVFQDYGAPLQVETVWEVLARTGLPRREESDGVVTVHDPCVARFEPALHRAARALAGAGGLTVEEMPHQGENAACCGEGGALGFHAPDLALAWEDLRAREAGDRRVLTYCAGCAEHLGTRVPTLHLLDLLFGPKDAPASGVQPVGTLRRYWNRVRLARRAHREIGCRDGR